MPFTEGKVCIKHGDKDTGKEVLPHLIQEELFGHTCLILIQISKKKITTTLLGMNE